MRQAMAIAVALLTGALTSGDELTAPANAIRVVGAAQVKTAPDRVTVTLGVTAEEPTVQKAVLAHNASVRALFGVFDKAGLPASAITTGDFSVGQATTFREGRMERSGYRISKSFVIALDDIRTLEDLITRALENGANEVSSISFETTKLKDLRERARELALTLAMEKAAKLASRAGRTLGPILSITELAGSVYSPYSLRWEAGYQGQIRDLPPGGLPEEATLSAGSLSVTAELLVDFTLN